MWEKACDRCGQHYPAVLTDFDYDDEWWRYCITKGNHPYSEHRIDLCPNCRQELYIWLKEGKDDKELSN